MEQFIVSARKYRPTTFEDVVGQQAITNTLENAIANNHLAQALLFTGPRGVGKTTCARILAKRINQEANTTEDEDFAFNIFELDAASNNSVENIRALIDQVRIPPQVGKYKVYIIDEVHMLTTAAFNAFLKTLEEPPKHAIFILATTEKHKIIPTILSRCQIFDFRRIGVQDIKAHLADVATSEGIDAEDDALHIIAQKADGALRDALSIFDRVVSFAGKNLTREAVTENLNVLDYTWYFKVTDLLLDNNIPEVLLTYNQILSKGFDGQHFIIGLASHFRDLMVCRHQSTIELLEVGEQIKTMYFEQSQKTSSDFLIPAIDLANDCDLKYKTSQNQRLLVELCLMQLASLTFEAEKKNLGRKVKEREIKIIPPAHFTDVAAQIESIAPPKQELSSAKNVSSINIAEPAIAKDQTKPEEKAEPIEKVVSQERKANSPEEYFKSRVAGTSIFSARGIQHKKVQKVEENPIDKLDPEELPKNEFSTEAFMDAWEEYAAEAERQGKFILSAQLTLQEPKLKGHLISLQFPNNTIKEEIEQEKHELLKYLREKLNNFALDLTVTVKEEMEEKFAYFPQEKFNLLKEKNPLLERFKQEFDLDI